MTIDDWPTREKDLILTTTIMQKHSYLYKDSLNVLDHFEITPSGEYINVILPEWFEELALTLKVIHGEQIYSFILSKIIKEIIANFIVKIPLTPEQGRLLEVIWMSYLNNHSMVTH